MMSVQDFSFHFFICFPASDKHGVTMKKKDKLFVYVDNTHTHTHTTFPSDHWVGLLDTSGSFWMKKNQTSI